MQLLNQQILFFLHENDLGNNLLHVYFKGFEIIYMQRKWAQCEEAD